MVLQGLCLATPRSTPSTAGQSTAAVTVLPRFSGAPALTVVQHRLGEGPFGSPYGTG